MDDTHNPYASPDPDAPTPPPGPLQDIEIDLSSAVISEGVLAYDDVLKATRLNSRSHRWAHVAIGILGSFSVALAYPIWIEKGVTVLLAYLFGMASAWGGLCYGVFKAPIRSATELWDSLTVLREPFREVVTEDVIQTTSNDISTIATWSDFCNYRRSEAMVLLYLVAHPQLFSIFPRRTFQSDADWEQFCDWVTDKLPPA